jgi:hypothetical protein
MRAALWGRVAARSQKLAIVHRLARLAGPEEINEFNPPVMVELEDVNFGIAVANWSARLACDLVNEKIVDDSSLELQRRITGILREQKQVELWRLNRSLRSFSNSEVRGMLVRLEREGALVIEQQATKGRTKEVIRWLAS